MTKFLSGSLNDSAYGLAFEKGTSAFMADGVKEQSDMPLSAGPV
jgi:hypothetical protein